MHLTINPAFLANTLHILLHTGTSKDPAYKYRLSIHDYIQKNLREAKVHAEPLQFIQATRKDRIL